MGEENGRKDYKTNSKGQFHLNSLVNNKEYSIFMEFKKSDWKQDFTHSNSNNKYTFTVKKRKFLWWWIPVIIGFFLLLSLIPTEVNHDFTVYDNQTKMPIAECQISNFSGYQSQALNNFTDLKGELKIGYGKRTIYNQIFNGFNTSFSATKNGYVSVVNSTLAISFFKTNRSKVYLDPFRVDTTYKIEDPIKIDTTYLIEDPIKIDTTYLIEDPLEKPISECNSGGDADDSGG